MSLSLYDISIPQFIHGFKILSSLLEKGATHNVDDPKTLIESRLIDNMGDLAFQVQRASNTAKRLGVLVGKAEQEVWEDKESTFPQLQARITKTIIFLEKLDPKTFNEMEEQGVTSHGETLPGRNFVVDYMIPNFYFHYVTAYALLRKEGVPIGKRDYLGIK